MARKDLGIAIFIIGIAMLAFTFYMAYGLYEYLFASPQAAQAAVQGSGAANSTAQGIAQAVVGDVISSIPIDRYITLFLAILVLYALANVSFKIAKLGIEFMKNADDNGGKQKPK
ncbi:MAG: hypothetical protein QXW10_00160 [Candidatus Micrarchaeaceae archaeon]